MEENQETGYNNRRMCLLANYIAQHITEELEKERKNMLEKRERVTVAATGMLMPIYCI